MGRSTFSGPIKVGNNDTGAGTVPVITTLDPVEIGMPIGTKDFQVKIPAGLIQDAWVDQSAAAVGGTVTISIGKTAGGTEFLAATAVTAGGRFKATVNLAFLAAADLAAETTVFIRVVVATGAITAGKGLVCIQHLPR